MLKNIVTKSHEPWINPFIAKTTAFALLPSVHYAAFNLCIIIHRITCLDPALPETLRDMIEIKTMQRFFTTHKRVKRLFWNEDVSVSKYRNVYAWDDSRWYLKIIIRTLPQILSTKNINGWRHHVPSHQNPQVRHLTDRNSTWAVRSTELHRMWTRAQVNCETCY